MAQASDRAELNGVEMELAAAAVRDAGARARGESVVDLFVHTACAESQYACRATSTTESAFHTYRCCASLIPCGDCHQLRLREPRLSGPFADAVLVATEAHDRNAFSRRAEVAARCPPVTQPHSAAARKQVPSRGGIRSGGWRARTDALGGGLRTPIAVGHPYSRAPSSPGSLGSPLERGARGRASEALAETGGTAREKGNHPPRRAVRSAPLPEARWTAVIRCRHPRSAAGRARLRASPPGAPRRSAPTPASLAIFGISVAQSLTGRQRHRLAATARI